MAGDGTEIKADLHVHTVASGHAYCTVREICIEAAQRGLQMVGITDHGPSMPGGAHPYHFANLVVLPRELFGVKVLRSAECNILDTEGTLDLHPRILKRLDIVQAGLHPFCGYEGESVEENTAAVLAAVESGLVDVLVHPGNPLYPLDYGTVVESASSNGVLLEINNASFTLVRKGSLENCRKILEIAHRIGARVCVGSDAHDASLVGGFEKALELIDEVGYDRSRVVNRDASSVLEFLESRGKDISF